MDDLISRQAAIDALIALGDWYVNEHSRRVVHQCIRAVYDVPSAQPEQRWIPCSERLPEESGNYLVTAMWKGRPEVDMDYWQFDCMWDDWGDEVIAWMSLPEPWKGGEDETD